MRGGDSLCFQAPLFQLRDDSLPRNRFPLSSASLEAQGVAIKLLLHPRQCFWGLRSSRKAFGNIRSSSGGTHEADYYDACVEEMEEIFDENVVHEQLRIAYGSSLKIDFYIGHPQHGGVGVEFKRPKTNSELQRALGQVQQYKTRYGDQLLIVLVPDDIDKAQKNISSR